QPAPGVVDAAAPAAAHALFELEDRRMILALAARVLAHQDVEELRIRPQQLRARDGRTVEAGTRKPSLERIRHLLVQYGSSKGQILRVELVDVDDPVVRAAETQVPPGRPRVLEPD